MVKMRKSYTIIWLIFSSAGEISALGLSSIGETSVPNKVSERVIYKDHGEKSWYRTPRGNREGTTSGSATPTTTETVTAPVQTSPPPASHLIPENSCQDFVSHCNFKENVTIAIDIPCIFSCTYSVKDLSILLLEVHLNYKNPQDNPVFVSAEQMYFINSWTLPIIFPSHRDMQPFTSIAKILCPPTFMQTAEDSVQVRITTKSEEDISIKVGLNIRPYVLKMGDSVTMKVSPVSPEYRLYQWSAEESSVLVSAVSLKKSATVCAILAIQNAKCPVFTDEASLRAGGGSFQTFTTNAGMVATRSQFPDGIHMVFWSLPDDDRCTLADDSSTNRTSRQKSVKLQVFSHSTIGSTWHIFVLTGVIVSLVVMGLTILSLRNINRWLKAPGHDVDSGQSRTTSTEYVEHVVVFIGPSGDLLPNSDSGHQQGTSSSLAGATGADHSAISESSQLLLQGSQSFSDDNCGQGSSLTSPGTSGGDCNVTIRERDSDDDNEQGSNSDLPGPSGGDQNRGNKSSELQVASKQNGSDDKSVVLALRTYLSSTIYAPDSSFLNSTEDKPVHVLWWKRYAIYESTTVEAQVSEMGFQHNILIMAAFTILPFCSLILPRWKMLFYHGDEDQCFFNSRCLISLWIFHDFSRVFTSMCYVLLGVAFNSIVLRHRFLTRGTLTSCSVEHSVGVSHHYGPFRSLGYGQIVQGIVSAFYHTCPNNVSLTLDMMFMYVMSVTAIICIWGLRHGNVTHHVYPTIGLVVVTLLLADMRQWVGRVIFWICMCSFYVILLIATTVSMSKYDVWSFSPRIIIHIWKGWKEFKEEIAETSQGGTNLNIKRIGYFLIPNLLFISYGAITDPNSNYYILIASLMNLGLYFVYYILRKRVGHDEKGTTFAWICFIVSFILWGLALIAFHYHNTDSEASASDSRALNSPCAFLGVFDTHDAWHLLSSFALFTFFNGLLTLDDDLCKTSSKEIPVF